MKRKHELSLTSSGEHSNGIESLTKFDFGNVPVDDIKIEIVGYLAPTMKNILALTSKSHFNLFKPNFKSDLINKLLVCAAWGKQDEVEQLLKTSPELMLEKTTFTDCSGRTFSNISVFEFVLWALDTRYMIDMMFNCLPKDENGLSLANKLEKQYLYHQEHGITYTLEEKIITENHFDFSVLINALQVYVDNYVTWNGPELEKHWYNVVEKAQRYLPAHVMQHYCEPNVPFYPLPKFEAEQFVRTLEFYSYFKRADMNWHGLTSSSISILGENIDVGRAEAGTSMRRMGPRARMLEGGVRRGVEDLAAIKTLCEVRTKDYLAIPSKIAFLFDKKEFLEPLLSLSFK
jgi:hypothetical protein